jgi:hypothetical protein
MKHASLQDEIEFCKNDGRVYLSDMMLLENFERSQLLNKTLLQQSNGRIEVSSCLDEGNSLILPSCLRDVIQCDAYKYERRYSKNHIFFYVENSRADHSLQLLNSMKGKVKYFHQLQSGTTPVKIKMKKPGREYPWCFVHFQGMQQKDYVYPVAMMLYYMMSRFRQDEAIPSTPEIHDLFNR